jgi:RNA polymerase sigma-70 factor (ECF subfamily)
MEKTKQHHFLKLYEPIHDRFERFCRARVYGDMEYKDLMNEAMMVAYQKIDKLQSDDVFFSFLCGICVRILANENRKKKAESYPIEEKLNAFTDVNANTELDAEVTLLHEALVYLPEVQREAIILFEMTGFSITEIAEMQDSSVDAVKQRLKRGREKLLKILSFESENKTGEVKYG